MLDPLWYEDADLVTNSAIEIANLIYRYAEYVDNADLSGVSALLKEAKTKLPGPGELQDEVGSRAKLQAMLRSAASGSHDVVANPIIEIDEASNRATCRTYFTVIMLAGPGSVVIPLRPVATGRYLDRFERVDGHWRFSYRDFTLLDRPNNDVAVAQSPLDGDPAARLEENADRVWGPGEDQRGADSATEIANLLYRYADLKDGGDLPGASALFKHAKFKMADHEGLQDSAAQLATLKAIVPRYSPGMNRARHLITNPIIEIDENAKKATCRSYYAIFRATKDDPLQPVASGRYHDSFERVDGKWRFTLRDHTLFDMKGHGYGHNAAQPVGHSNRGTPERIENAAGLDSGAEIANLLYRYAEFIDNGEFSEATSLLKNAKIKTADCDEPQDHAVIFRWLQTSVKIYPCGTPQTKHLVTNPIIEVNEGAGKATSRSLFTVLQASAEIPLQVIASGRYHDQFARIDGKWCFTFRDFALLDLRGNIGGYLQHSQLP